MLLLLLFALLATAAGAFLRYTEMMIGSVQAAVLVGLGLRGRRYGLRFLLLCMLLGLVDHFEQALLEICQDLVNLCIWYAIWRL